MATHHSWNKHCLAAGRCWSLCWLYSWHSFFSPLQCLGSRGVKDKLCTVQKVGWGNKLKSEFWVPDRIEWRFAGVHGRPVHLRQPGAEAGGGKVEVEDEHGDGSNDPAEQPKLAESCRWSLASRCRCQVVGKHHTTGEELLLFVFFLTNHHQSHFTISP